jgi:DNA-binding LacI/PurR family transcriptional regulator
MLGFGKSECVTDIVFDKNEYYQGESARVSIACDNSKCSKAVRGFKFKLHRKILVRSTNTKQAVTLTLQEYVFALKEQGIPAKAQVTREFEIMIPTSEANSDKMLTLHPDDDALLHSLPPTV